MLIQRYSRNHDGSRVLLLVLPHLDTNTTTILLENHIAEARTRALLVAVNNNDLSVQDIAKRISPMRQRQCESRPRLHIEVQIPDRRTTKLSWTLPAH